MNPFLITDIKRLSFLITLIYYEWAKPKVKQSKAWFWDWLFLKKCRLSYFDDILFPYIISISIIDPMLSNCPVFILRTFSSLFNSNLSLPSFHFIFTIILTFYRILFMTEVYGQCRSMLRLNQVHDVKTSKPKNLFRTRTEMVIKTGKKCKIVVLLYESIIFLKGTEVFDQTPTFYHILDKPEFLY